jgi:tricorn protease
MWIGDTIYYNSDKDGKFNLYAYDTKSGKTTQTTTYKDWDVRWSSSDNQSKIIYERNGELEILDVNSKKATKLSINVPDDGINKRIRTMNVSGYVENYSLSPKGERAVFAARGDIFSAPIEKGATRNLTKSSDAHDKAPAWSPDGRQIAYISDKSGEEEIWVVNQDGNSAPQQLTTGGQAMRYFPSWSPDGKSIAFSDKDGKLYILNVADKSIKQIADDPRGQIFDYEWSPKGNFIAFSMNGTNGFSSVYIYSVADGKLNKVTDSLFNAQNPTFDPNGNYIYFLSDREFAPQISGAEFNYATNKSTQIYALALRKDVKNPFPAESDEVTIADVKNADAPVKPADKVETIDFEGIQGRATKVPLPAENYGGLSAKTGFLMYIVQAPFYYGRNGGLPSLRIFSMRDRKETTLSDPAFGYTLSPDGSKILASVGGGYMLMDANPQGVLTKKPVSTSGLVADINPQQEWNQIFNEVWRRYRDWFYVKNMHGYDWAKIREDYKKWLPYVSHRSDLNYVIAEMCAELTVQHAYIEGGDFNIPQRIPVALMGARFEADKANNRYKISRIFGGQNEEDIYRSPLTEVGNDVKVGDYIIAINGENVTTDKDIYAYLRGKAGSAVQLTVNSSPTANGAKTITYRPITDEGNLVYLDWITKNREKVSQLSNGKLGYLHIPDMGANGIREFIKYYYGQLDKEGLVVDVRANGGGNVSRMLIERLRRKVLGVNFARTDDQGNTYPDGVFNGPMIAILNENSSSDGDIFPYMFREAGLGQLVGKRSWGGVVGITNRGSLIDGSNVFVPGSALANPKGEYVIEGYGVDPDIEVDNDPKSVIDGKDPQLERAVSEIMKKLATPVKLPNRPKEPIKNNQK